MLTDMELQRRRELDEARREEHAAMTGLVYLIFLTTAIFGVAILSLLA